MSRRRDDDDPEHRIGRGGVEDLPLFHGTPKEPEPEPPVPIEHTETQDDWRDREAPDWRTMGPQVVGILEAAQRRGCHPFEVLHALELPDRKIVTVRSCLTILHQAEEIVRTKLKRDRQHVYVHPRYWRPEMGSEPSKPHHGRGSRPGGR